MESKHNISYYLLIFGLFWSAQFNCVFAAEKEKVDIKSITKCGVADGGEKGIKAEPKLVQDGSDKYLDFKLETNFEIDEQFSYSMEIKKLEGSVFLPFMNLEGDFCTAADTHMKAIWSKVKQESNPQLPMDECKVPAGSYTLEQFRVNDDDYTVPKGMNGDFQIEGKGYKSDGTEVLCFVVEAAVQ